MEFQQLRRMVERSGNKGDIRKLYGPGTWQNIITDPSYFLKFLSIFADASEERITNYELQVPSDE